MALKEPKKLAASSESSDFGLRLASLGEALGTEVKEGQEGEEEEGQDMLLVMLLLLLL